MMHFNSMVNLRVAFIKDRHGSLPCAVRMHPEYFDRLMYEMAGRCLSVAPDRTLLNMEILIDSRWPRMFPCCLDRFGREEALMEGARTA